jgi:hypothetical protein
MYSQKRKSEKPTARQRREGSMLGIAHNEKVHNVILFKCIRKSRKVKTQGTATP